MHPTEIVPHCEHEAGLNIKLGTRELAINLIVGLGVPSLTIPLYYVVQSFRYTIVEDVGCWPASYLTPWALILAPLWPVLISLVSLTYAVLTLREFMRIRRQFSRVLSESGTNLNLSRFFRLMALVSTDIICTVPLSLYFLIQNAVIFPYTWASWEVIHKHRNDVATNSQKQISAIPGSKTGFEFNLWSIPGCAFLFFMYFGLSSDARRQYKLVFWIMLSPLGFKPPAPTPENNAQNSARRLDPNKNLDAPSETVCTSLGTLTLVNQVDEPDDGSETSRTTLPSEVKISDLESRV
ncbi:STE3-type pheromone receptor [Ceratobasidium sp. AG-Ba]|nr:STE3-type pheromone receptor [Ceratobasidium sp. AG-Ba]